MVVLGLRVREREGGIFFQDFRSFCLDSVRYLVYIFREVSFIFFVLNGLLICGIVGILVIYFEVFVWMIFVF